MSWLHGDIRCGDSAEFRFYQPGWRVSLEPGPESKKYFDQASEKYRAGKWARSILQAGEFFVAPICDPTGSSQKKMPKASGYCPEILGHLLIFGSEGGNDSAVYVTYNNCLSFSSRDSQKAPVNELDCTIAVNQPQVTQRRDGSLRQKNPDLKHNMLKSLSQRPCFIPAFMPRAASSAAEDGGISSIPLCSLSKNFQPVPLLARPSVQGLRGCQIESEREKCRQGRAPVERQGAAWSRAPTPPALPPHSLAG